MFLILVSRGKHNILEKMKYTIHVSLLLLLLLLLFIVNIPRQRRFEFLI